MQVQPFAVFEKETNVFRVDETSIRETELLRKRRRKFCSAVRVFRPVLSNIENQLLLLNYLTLRCRYVVSLMQLTSKSIQQRKVLNEKSITRPHI